ncbi:hypothetical protein PZ938_00235 [Luteipulveratus sp. YIM 133132]|uniref:hypothetical protein n=1 Tax=Luteipulveratus flavus TaxID=3031728 RepID=UPI0023B15AC6|nr:hypothetical protein [Luteipulveratus sp. YIM 133132]MDE9364022.1 hypothetical protein [Luteipulveratus sp. YIM 133132]
MTMLAIGAVVWTLIFWAMGSWAMRAAAYGNLLLVAILVALMPDMSSPDHQLYAGTMIVILLVQAVALWLGGHYRFAAKFGYWKSRIAYRLWPFRQPRPKVLPRAW